MKLSVIIPAFENPGQLRIMLESLGPALNNLDCASEVFVVDDASRADLGSVAREFPFARYLRLTTNSGPAAARNAGVKASSGDYVVFFDSDVALKPDTLRLFEETFNAGTEAVIGEYADKPLSKGIFPQVKCLITKSWTPRGNYVSIFAPRACGMKRSVYEDAGGFNEEIRTASVEDYEFGDRLLAKGHNILYNPNILVYHHHPSFMKQCRVFYERSRDLSKYLINRRRPYEWCASNAEGVSSIAGTAFVVFAAAAVIAGSAVTGAAAVLFFAVFTAANFNFVRITVRDRGAGFLLAALFFKLGLCLPITAGFAVGSVLYVARAAAGMLGKRGK
ncbi:MAG: glycosyltransferase [Candidatus Omnitrophota bacterium]